MAALLVAHDRPASIFGSWKKASRAGDEIVLVARGPRHDRRRVNALLYKPGRPADQLEKALRIPALSTGWQTSFKTLLEPTQSGSPPRVGRFPPLRVCGKQRESGSVTSLVLEPADAAL